MDNNIDAQIAVGTIEKFVYDRVMLAFPMMAIGSIPEYDSDDDGDLVGFFVEKSGAAYHFVISKDDPNPLLQRVNGEAVEGAEAPPE